MKLPALIAFDFFVYISLAYADCDFQFCSHALQKENNQCFPTYCLYNKDDRTYGLCHWFLQRPPLLATCECSVQRFMRDPLTREHIPVEQNPFLR